ncbi:MAG TPA: M1 family metallopeptidase [Acidimicrobiales bacterium]|nr:M1 family metallopeptidase [Acidimicrobiales bacterium]
MDLATTRRSWRRRAAVAGAATVLFLGIGCSSDSTTGAPPASTSLYADSATTSSNAPTTTLPPTTTRTITPVAGAPGVGDVAFPGLGNGGYDVASYTIAIDARPEDPAIRASTRIDAVATSDLLSFNLDLHGFVVRSVSVDDAAAAFARDGAELVVTPSTPIPFRAKFSVEVAYDGVPEPLSDPDIGRVGWIDVGPTSYVVGEPHGAHTWFPGNDHPSDKAVFEIRITVPVGVTAVANGVLREKLDTAESTTWIWDQREPMATYLAMVAIGDFAIHTGVGPRDLPLRHVFATRLAPAAADATVRTAEMIEVLESWFGAYPFATYGALVVDDAFGFALETQTLSLFPRSIAVRSPRSERIQVHELAHQWFGNSVTLSRWQDIWLNEGFATYAESLWLERTQLGYNIDREMQTYADKRYGPITQPTADTLFARAHYERGALVLHALRRTVGDQIFSAILLDYASSFRHSSVDTAAFVALVSRHAGQPMNDFFDQWLNAPTTPPLPG